MPNCSNRVRTDMVRIGPSNLLRGESGLFARENISEGTVVASFGAVRALRKGEVGTRTRLGYSFIVRETGGRTLEITPRQGITQSYLAHTVNHTCHRDFENCKFLHTGVVVTGPFINFLLHNHFITEKILKKKSGDVNDEANFSLFILLHKRAKPILPPWARELKTLTLRPSLNPLLPPYPHPHLRARTQTFTPPPSKSLYSRAKKHGARIEQKISLQHATL